MSIGAGGILRATLMLGLALGATTASAQTSPNGTWTDPPVRGAASAPPPTPAAADPVGPEKDPAPVAKSDIKSETASTPETSAPSVTRQAAVPVRRRMREARRKQPQVSAEAPRVRTVTSYRVARRTAMRPVPRRVVARPYTPRTFAAAPYPDAPLPVGRVEGPIDGVRRPIFTEGDDRMRRIAAAQAAGYLVVRARPVQYPDGRIVRSYRPYDDDDGLD